MARGALSCVAHCCCCAVFVAGLTCVTSIFCICICICIAGAMQIGDHNEASQARMCVPRGAGRSGARALHSRSLEPHMHAPLTHKHINTDALMCAQFCVRVSHARGELPHATSAGAVRR